jgi:hypothetical protein
MDGALCPPCPDSAQPSPVAHCREARQRPSAGILAVRSRRASRVACRAGQAMNTVTAHPLDRRPGNTMTGDWTPGSDADVARRVVQLFERAVVEPSERAMAALREATIALATAVRATALRPERAVIMLKDLLRGHGGAGWAPSIAARRGAVPASPESLVYGELFTWWVDAYYGERPPERTARHDASPTATA